MEEPIQAIYEPCLKEISSLQTFPEGILGLISHNRPSEYQKRRQPPPLDPVAKVIIRFVIFVYTIHNIWSIYNIHLCIVFKRILTYRETNEQLVESLFELGSDEDEDAG